MAAEPAHTAGRARAHLDGQVGHHAHHAREGQGRLNRGERHARGHRDHEPARDALRDLGHNLAKDLGLHGQDHHVGALGEHLRPVLERAAAQRLERLALERVPVRHHDASGREGAGLNEAARDGPAHGARADDADGAGELVHAAHPPTS